MIAKESLNGRLVYGVVGTANTGKSTFINDLCEATSKRPPRLRFGTVGKDYRDEIVRRGLAINRNGDERTQTAIFDILCENTEIARGETCTDRILMDRTPLDAYVYTLWHRRYGRGNVSDETLHRMEDLVWRATNRIDRIFWIPMSMCDGVGVVEDGVRDTDANYRRQIDMLFRKTMSSLRVIPNVTILHGTRDERVKMALEYERIDRMSHESRCISMQKHEETWTDDELEALHDW